MYTVPEIEECIEFAKSAGMTNILEVPISPREYDKPFQCHNNCEFNPVKGYYVVKDSHGLFHAFSHSVLNTGNNLLDVTPTLDDRTYNIFMYGSEKYKNEHITYNKSTVFINKEKETELMYYVYALIDPRTDEPFYVGKGKDNRALSHFQEKQLLKEGNTKKTAKIRKLQKLGYEPKIEFYAQNIEDEELAYTIESHYIRKYGRIGYENNGILTNICEDNRPPIHKGKTYEEIYGKKAVEQKEKRNKLQQEAGGWFRGHKHTEESKKKISEASAGKNNPRYGVKVKGTDIATKIGDANRGKKHYQRNDIKIYYIEGLDISIYSNDLHDFCKDNNYSLGTFNAQIDKNWPTSRKGKNKGLKMRLATEEEKQKVCPYVNDGTKQDVTEETFKGFSL